MTRIISIVGGLQPSTPTIGTATAGDTTASVAFTPSTYIGKGTITYTATSSPGGITGTASSSPITVTGLTNGTAYTFTVTGTTNYGVTSIASGSSNSITPALGDTGSMFAINSITVPSGGAASVTFSSIPQTYTHLQIRGFSKSDYNGGTAVDGCSIRFNGDTGANYADHYLIGNGSTSVAGGDANRTFAALYQQNNNTYPTSSFAAAVIDILDYTNTNKFKTMRTLGGNDTNGTGIEKGSISLWSGLWRSTSAITSLTLQSGSMNRGFPEYTQFALYGIKGA